MVLRGVDVARYRVALFLFEEVHLAHRHLWMIVRRPRREPSFIAHTANHLMPATQQPWQEPLPNIPIRPRQKYFHSPRIPYTKAYHFPYN